MNTIQTSKMQVEIWSDIMCPFCYIGKRNFEGALSKFANSENIEIIWKSFQLDPTLPEKEEFDHIQYLVQRKGMPANQVHAMLDQVTQTAKNAGLDYDFEHVVTVNSFNAHRVIQFAKTKGLGDEIEERFFKAYFTEGKDIADRKVLSALGQEIGLTEDDIEQALSNDEYAYRVTQDIQEAQSIGVRGVPFFVFDRKYAVSGAQPTQAFADTLNKSFAEWAAKNPISPFIVSDGPSCSPDGHCE
ncbi:DsbA family oxidoreductase [Sphingobacterium spiritivorum]|uniref:DsbA family oxidoreductase n=1 Tax=Sphingobacterium spiritivorum TaxID=258 RepID=UPI003DA3D25C